MNNKKGFIALIGLLLTAALIIFICYIMMKPYSKGSSMDKGTKEVLEEDAVGHIEILERTKKKIGDIQKQSADRYKQYEE